MSTRCVGSVCLLLSTLTFAQTSSESWRVLTNHLGYETNGPKHAVVLGQARANVSGCSLADAGSGRVVQAVALKESGPVQKWKDWYFWTLDFDGFANEGRFRIECKTSAGEVRSFPFAVQQELLERSTVSNVINYFKDERNSGEIDKADRHLPFEGRTSGTVDAHGGW